MLEAAGWRFRDAADFLEMSNDERQLLDTRIEIALAIRDQRRRVNLSQKELAKRLKTSQPRIVKIERAATDVSLDQILRAYSAAGGRIAVKQVGKTATQKSRATTAGRPAASRATIELKLS